MTKSPFHSVTNTLNILDKGWLATEVDDANNHLPAFHLYLNTQNEVVFAGKCDLNQLLCVFQNNMEKALTKGDWSNNLRRFTQDVMNNTSNLSNADLGHVGIQVFLGYFLNTKIGELALQKITSNPVPMSLFAINHQTNNASILRPFFTEHREILTPQTSLEITTDIIAKDLMHNPNYYSTTP